MGKLIVNEWAKLFRRTGTLVMVGLVILLVMGVAGVYKYDEIKNPPQENPKWKEALQQQIKDDTIALKGVGKANANMKMYYERAIAVNKYKVEHNIAPESEKHVWVFVRDAEQIISFVGIFVIVVAAGMVSSEFSWGTVKLLLIRPISRTKILLSKYLTVLLFGLTLLATLFVFSWIAGAIFFGFPEGNISHLAYFDGEVVERSLVVQLIVEYLLSSIDLLMLATMAFMISAVFRNSNLAIGIALFLMFMGQTATMLLATKFEWAKYILFANTNLTMYFDGVPPIESMTLTFSIVMLIVYYLVFQVLAFTVFAKRDVAS
ncbi:ABC transporter permease [Bacillus marasmi]|uniref:ABC transporter permease n=1 Tax=Bacillus marasmi TaxID=1926279 RepID=UPI0011CA1A2B|nr:ABC transporter permease [Bacillus marasmi]